MRTPARAGNNPLLTVRAKWAFTHPSVFLAAPFPSLPKPPQEGFVTTHTVPAGRLGVHNLTLTADTEEVVQFEQDISTIEIVNLDGAAAVYFTVNGVAATVAGSHTRVLPAAINSVLYEPRESDATRVSLISSGTPTVSVTSA